MSGRAAGTFSSGAARGLRRGSSLPGVGFALILFTALLTSACESPPGSDAKEDLPSGGAAAALAPAERNGMYDDPPAMTTAAEVELTAVFRTEKGDIRVRLFNDLAPVTVNNFVFLAREGFYNDTHFHRVLADFMAQGGDPSGTGAGGPGYQFQDEIVQELQFDRAGLLAMANAGPNTNGSQFFLTFAATPWLNGNHTIFGEVIEGMDVLLSLTLRDPMAASSSEFAGDLLEKVAIEEAGSQ